ncbi:enoyl-CoA hydratase/isomerase family protein [Actinopolymorpha alba]|uniref:enoyl-CoA hydratase/isomerase family protein n=1 Tax=Actinopolymorpha alba TaxID=533267 RepID=UPI00037C636D|nr:enoyl-CoA hydratase/isomerase family protein [Actinopolymorpha alba]
MTEVSESTEQLSGRKEQPHEHLVEERDGAVAVLRIDREHALGALSRGMVEALVAYLDGLAHDDSVRVLVVTGTGRGFIAGADIREYDGVSQAAFDDYQRLGRAAFGRLASLPQPTIAAVNGYAFGGGFEVALACDLILASTAARFALPEVKLGLLPGGGGTQRLARAIGVRATKELVMTGRSMRPDEAERRGLVARVVEPDELMPAARELARTLAARAPRAVREAKRLIDDGVEASLETGWTLEQGVLSSLYATADAREGIRAFIEKRDPAFTGD